MKDDDELSQSVKDGIKAGEAMINDFYNLIEEWKERGISEENIARVLVFIALNKDVTPDDEETIH